METCENCRRSIGDLQPAHLIGEHVYCEMCYPIVPKKQEAEMAPTIPYAQPTPPVPVVQPNYQYQMKAGDIICPNVNCRYVGPGRHVARGSIIVGLILSLFTCGIGLLYFIFFSGFRTYCPRCGLQIANQN
jgi:hypothetical protein